MIRICIVFWNYVIVSIFAEIGGTMHVLYSKNIKSPDYLIHYIITIVFIFFDF